MLNLSASGDYGLMVIGHLAQVGQGQFVSLRSVARSRGLPLKYVERVAGHLMRAGILLSREGRQGGYALAKDPSEVRLADVLEVLEGSIRPVACTHNGRCCGRSVACERKTGYQKVHHRLYELLSGYSLADILPKVQGVIQPKKLNLHNS